MINLAAAFGVFLAYSNGANDNFKGVATLFGSATTSYRKALAWATVATVAGALLATYLARDLISAFSGKGLVPDAVVATPGFSVAVALSAAITVMAATRFGFPVSTTHVLTGALVGAGWIASPVGVSLAKLGSGFFLPLLISPVLAVGLTLILYPAFRYLRARLGVAKETCLCMGTEVVARIPAGESLQDAVARLQVQAMPTLTVDSRTSCQERYQGSVLGVDAGQSLNFLHFLSAGVTSFARGLNDAPKIAALVLAGGALTPVSGVTAVAAAMALGGLLHAKRVAETMAHGVTAMNPGQGFTANLVTSTVVIFASKLGVPVSTTHVSCGALFGIGTVTRQGHWKTIARILIAWVTTLPVAAVLGAICFWVLG